MAISKNQYGTFETDKKIGGTRLSSNPALEVKAQKLYGKNFDDLNITQRTQIRTGNRGFMSVSDSVTFEQYLDDYKKMAADPDYKPKYVKPNVGTGMSAQQRRARAEAKKTIEGFESKFQKNVSKRKRLKLKEALEADPERKQEVMAKKGDVRRRRRAAKLLDKKTLTLSEKELNRKQSLITRQLNDKIKANPNIVLKNKELMDKLSITVSRDGDIIRSKPTMYELEKRGLYEIDHQRDIRKIGSKKDFPYNRNLILGPHNRSGGFKDMAEKFIEKNPNDPKVNNILKVAEELKITLQPEVPTGTFKTKGIGYKQLPNATGKFIEYAKSTLPELVNNKLTQVGKKLPTKLGLPLLAGAVGMNLLTGEAKADEKVTYNPEIGSFVNPITEDKTNQNQLLEWATENPLTTIAGTSVALSAQEVPRSYLMRRGVGDTGPLPGGKGKIRSALGISGALKPLLTTLGTPAMALGFEGLLGKQRLEEGETMSEILTDPLGPSLGLAFMEPLSKAAGVVRGAPKRGLTGMFKNYADLSNVGTARPGLTSKVLRLGMSPRMIAGASRFLGLPGLALTTGLAGYDAYKNYQNQEGMIYNLFNE